jgi:hypothetical protein
LLKDSAFRITDRLDQPVYVMDSSSTEDRLYFVPALH